MTRDEFGYLYRNQGCWHRYVQVRYTPPRGVAPECASCGRADLFRFKVRFHRSRRGGFGMTVYIHHKAIPVIPGRV